jgi:hypothetical protein
MHTGYMICHASSRESAVEAFMERYLSEYERYVFFNGYYDRSHKNLFEQQSEELKELIADYEKRA